MLNTPILRFVSLAALLSALFFTLGYGPEVEREFFHHTLGTVTIQDYFYYISLVNSWWAVPANPYDPSFHMRFLSELAGQPINNFMPLGLTPTFLFVLLPFALIATKSIFLSYCVWVGISLSAVFMVMTQTLRLPKANARRVYLLLLCSALFFSQASSACLMLGQTSMIAVALLAALLLAERAADRSPLSFPLVRGVFLFLLSIKVHYLILGGSVLLIRRDYKAIACATLLIAACTAISWSYSGQILYAEYFSSLQYFSGNSGHVEVDVVALSTSNSFRSAFASLLGLGSSSSVSKMILGIGLALTLLSCAKSAGRSYAPFCLAALVLLCFMPYVGGYEDLLCFTVLVGMELGTASTPRMVQAREFVLALLLICVLNRSLFWPTVTPLAWSVKLALLALVLFSSRLGVRNSLISESGKS